MTLCANSVAHSRRQSYASFQSKPQVARILQRKCACGQHAMGGECEQCKKKEAMLQGKSDGVAEHAVAPPIVHEVLRSRGQPLDRETRNFFEPRFGYDFSNVRVHTDAKAAESATAVNAQAYTVGRNLVFATGQPNFRDSRDRGLLAHELTHVVQQDGWSRSTEASGGLRIAPHDSFELAAERNTSSMLGTANHEGVRAPACPGSVGPGFVVLRQPQATSKARTISIGTEQVEVASAAEESEARRIFKTVKDEFGIDLNSPRGVQAMTALLAQGRTVHFQEVAWKVSELHAVEQGLRHFKSLLGRNRMVLGSGGGRPQELTSLSRINTGLGPLHVLTDPSTHGEHFSSSKNASLYDSASGSTELTDQKKAFEGTVVHEAAHALLGNYVDAFIAGVRPAYWSDVNFARCPMPIGVGPACTPPPEPPVTQYGATNAREDLAESAMFYFLEPNTLRSKAPQRFAVLKQILDTATQISGPTP